MRVDKHFETRTQAFNQASKQARRDAQIPRTQEPFSKRYFKLKDNNGGDILDSKNRPIETREYDYTNVDGDSITIQEHSIGHPDFPGSASEQPHFNVRDYNIVEPDGRRTTTPAKLKLVAKHYTFKRK